MKKLVLKDFSGGLYQVDDEENIPDNGFPVGEGLAKAIGTKLRSRKSSNSTHVLDAVGKMWFDSHLYTRVGSSLYRDSSSIYTGAGAYELQGFIATPTNGGNNDSYIYLTGFDVPKKVTTGGTVSNWGFIAPTSNPSLADYTPTGNLSPSSTYRYQVTFLNDTTGERSNPNPAVMSHTTGATIRSIRLTSIPTSSDPQVNRIEIWRSYTNGSALFLLTDIAEGTTSYNDSAADSTLDGAELISYDNNNKPSGVSTAYGPWNASMFAPVAIPGPLDPRSPRIVGFGRNYASGN